MARLHASGRNHLDYREDARSRSLARVQALATKVLAEAGNRNYRLSQADAELAVKDVQVADARGEGTDGSPWPGLWLASGPQHWPALLALYALALRRSCALLDPGVSDGMRAACAELRRAFGDALFSPAGDLRGRPCLSYLLSCHMVQLCAALDGGPTYGLPEAGEGPGAAPKLATESPEMDSYLAQCGLEMWENTIRRAREELDGGPVDLCIHVPPRSRQAACRVALRLAAAAFQAMPRGQDPSAASVEDGPAGAFDDAPQDRIPPSHAASLLLRALRCAREACRDEAVCAADLAPPGALSRLGRLWELRLAAAERAQLVEDHESWNGGQGVRWTFYNFEPLLLRLESPAGTGEGPPAAPSLDVAAALGAGYISRIERMMRVPGPVTKRLLRLVAEAECDPAAWAPVLAFGPLRDTLSLLATAARRVRRDAVEATASSHFEMRYSRTVGAAELLLATVSLRWLRGLAAGGSAADLGPFEVGEPDSLAAGPPRLRAAVSYIAYHLLPTAFRAMPPIVLDAARLSYNGYPVTVSLLGWLPLLAAARATLPWASSLLSGPEWGLAELLGCTLGQALLSGIGDVDDRGGMDGLLPALAAALRALVYLAPELLAAALSGATAFAIRVQAAALADCSNLDVDFHTLQAENRQALPESGVLQAVFGPGSDSSQPELLAALERLRTGTAPGCDPAAAPSGSTSASSSPVVVPDLPADLAEWVAAAALLLPPADLRLLLPCCANPRCTNLGGPSELALQLPVQDGGGSCGQQRYCSQSCSEEHRGAGPGL
ncbi:hypothetical protein GPECTOR_53g105 [Gonium pectorale]|uniref:Uncharacterized protein n=1 Tax=Gonium pectorale TaxID=33097 RepID=A0A150G6M4_GONPE|nr:hypothetical protein GPECTOR_53g105 [Gonium pectorale]|eukprot:KXZ45519.1 hypothetical protein GPECTOR_53g105 [Gonium pectorale]